MRGNHATHRRQYGITLIELMIVVAIIAILAAIGYPSYRDYVRRSNRAEGKSELMNAAALQEKFFSNNNTYTTDMTALGLDNTDPAITEKGFYSVDAAACAGGTIATCYVLTATPVAGGGVVHTDAAARVVVVVLAGEQPAPVPAEDAVAVEVTPDGGVDAPGRLA